MPRAARGQPDPHRRHGRHDRRRATGDSAWRRRRRGRRIVAVGTAEAVAAGFTGRDRRYDGRGRVAGARQHAHARADGALSRARRRPGADGLAQRYIFPAEAKTVSPDFVRVGTRLAALEMIRVGDDDLRRHVLLRGRDRATATHDAGPPRRARPDRDQVPGRRREDARRRAGRAPKRSSRNCRRPADRAGGRAARRLHARPRRRCWRAATSRSSTACRS